MMTYDCVVLGAGISGMTAAIYLKRAALNICIIEKSAPGGQINKTSLIENYPGFIGDGPTLAMNIYEQVNKLDIPYLYGDVKNIEQVDKKFLITTDTTTITTKKIIIATGRTPNKLGLPLEDELTNRGISWCAICDGPIFKEKKVAVIGSGNSSLEESLFLSTLCSEVVILNRSDVFKGNQYLIDKVNNCHNIKILYNTSVVALEEHNDKLESITIENGEVKQKLLVDGLFIYIGFTPDNIFLNNLKISNTNGYLNVDQDMKTSLDGIYACGDVINKKYYQISTGVGEGTTAALSIIHDLNKDS